MIGVGLQLIEIMDNLCLIATKQSSSFVQPLISHSIKMSLLGCVQSQVEEVFTPLTVVILGILLNIEQPVHFAFEQLSPLS